MAVLFFVLAALACTAHCKPSGDPGVVLKKNSEAHAIAGDHESKLSPPWIKEMEGYEEDINQALETLWPFINFLFGSDSNNNSNDNAKESTEDVYGDKMLVRWIPDDDDSNNFYDDFKDDSIINTSDDSIDLFATDSFGNSKDHSMDNSADYINDDGSRENLSKYFNEHDIYASIEEIHSYKRIKPEYTDHDSSDYSKYDPNDNTNKNVYINAGENYNDKIFAIYDVSNDDSTDDFMGGIDYHFSDGSSEDTFAEEMNIKWKSEDPLIRPQTPKINPLPTSTDSSKLVFVLLILNPNFTSLTKCTENSDKFRLPTTTELSADTYLPKNNYKDSAFQSTTHSLEKFTLPITTENSEDVIFSTNIDDSKYASPASITEDFMYTSDMTTEIVNTFTTNTDNSIETINTSESTIQDSSYASYMPTETVSTEAVNLLIPVTADMFIIQYADYIIATESTIDFEDFGFDTSDSEDSDDSCADEMIIQLVPDDSSVTSSTKKGSKDANPEPVPVPIPDTTTTTTTTTEAPAEVKTN